MLDVAYVGSVVPDRPPFNAPPFSRSGNLFQQEVLKGLGTLGLQPSLVLSFQTLPSFPGHRRFLVPRQVVQESGLPRIHLLGLFNLTPFKQLLLGCAAFLQLCEWSLRRLGRPRLILLYNLTSPPGLFSWLAARLTGAKLVALLCDVEIPGATVPDTLLFRLDFKMQKWLIPRLDGRVVVSEAIARDLAPGKSHVLIEGGVGEALIQATKGLRPPKRLGCPFRVAAVGKLDMTNGFDLILEAMAALTGEDVELHIAGAGPLVERVQNAAGQDPRIHFHGFLSLEGVLNLYRSCDLILVIRRTEARDTRYFFPGKLMEALVSGIPVLATPTGHLRETYGRYLFILEEERSGALAERIRQVRELPEVQRLDIAQRARAFMIEHKSWTNQTGKLGAYLEAVGTGSLDAQR